MVATRAMFRCREPLGKGEHYAPQQEGNGVGPLFAKGIANSRRLEVWVT